MFRLIYHFINDEGQYTSFHVKEKRIVSYNPALAKKQKAQIKICLWENRRGEISKAPLFCYGNYIIPKKASPHIFPPRYQMKRG